MSLLKTEFKAKTSTGETLSIDHHNLKKAITKLKSLHHKLRTQILILLDEHGKMTVTEIFVKLRIEQSVASQQLALLRASGVVNADRQGKFIYYSINAEQIEYLNGIAFSINK
jgi:ArsR family transcriptional regulator, virulence genes transcriptional regulator